MILTWLWRCWYSMNYRYCKVEAYRAYLRGEYMLAAEYESTAQYWEREYIMAGRKMV